MSMERSGTSDSLMDICNWVKESSHLEDTIVRTQLIPAHAH